MINCAMIELAKSFGMVLIEYDDGNYYDFHFELKDGIKILEPKYDNECWVLQFKEDLSYAQLCNPNLDFKSMSVDDCLSQVLKLKDLAVDFKFE